MPRPSPRDPLATGWAQLRDGAWTEAQESFTTALARDETPEALEGLSWAAWWQDDADTVFDARERAYRQYRDVGDQQSAARIAIWLGSDELDFHGAVAVARGWLRRARRLLDDVDPGPEHGWLAFHEGYLASLSGDAADAGRLAAVAADHGRRLGVTDLEMLGLALEGAALVARAEVDAGMRCLDEATATALAGEATVPISGAWACCFLVSSCAAVRDYDRAFEWCDRIADFADRYGSRYMLAFCRAEYGAVHLARGRWADAETTLQEAVEAFTRSRPAMVGGPLVALAELRRRQGRLDEAAQLLDDAGPSPGGLLCRGRMALDAGDAPQAVRLADRVLRQVPHVQRTDRVPGLELLVRAHLACGQLDAARAALAELADTVDLIGTGPWRATVAWLEGMLGAAEGEHETARTRLEDAVDAFDRSRAPYEAAVARISLAVSLHALGQGSTADREDDEARRQLTRLGVPADRVGGEAAVPAGITQREREVLALLAEGLTNRQIAARLVVSEHTVHRHVANILRKLDVPSRSGAAAWAVQAGVVADSGLTGTR